MRLSNSALASWLANSNESCLARRRAAAGVDAMRLFINPSVTHREPLKRVSRHAESAIDADPDDEAESNSSGLISKVYCD
jgi:hypothetical protein